MKFKTEFGERLFDLMSLHLEQEERSRRWIALTSAVLNGASASEIEATRPTIDNPFQGSDWRWAWFTGFDLGKRLRESSARGRRFADALDEAGGGFPFSGELWEVIGEAREYSRRVQ